MNPDQTAVKGAVWSWYILFAIQTTKAHHPMRKQTKIVVNGGEGLRVKKSQYVFFSNIFQDSQINDILLKHDLIFCQSLYVSLLLSYV